MELDEIGTKFGTDKASSGHNYLRHYERLLSAFRNEVFTLVEIGGLNGASLRMWREYFQRATIVCLDINPDVKQFESDGVHVEIGDASDAEFLSRVSRKYKDVSVVIDDGSHRWDHQRIAFQWFFPCLNNGGIYIVEDLHTSFEPGFSGEDCASFFDYALNFLRYLNLRGERRKNFETTFNKQYVQLAKSIASIEYIPRALCFKKK